jgi:hypothetical protein
MIRIRDIHIKIIAELTLFLKNVEAKTPPSTIMATVIK